MSYAGVNAYQQSRVIGSSPEQLVPMLYERLLADLRRGSFCITSGDIEGRSNCFGHASEIVFELLSALDFDKGGELAGRLAALYGWFAGEITELGRRPDVVRLQRLIDMVATLHSSWVEAASVAARDRRA
jgi:flagellar secretion chaperone FliS